MQWVVQSKLRAPRLRDDVVARPTLLDTLHHAVMSHHLTLVSAPAGFGKSTLLAALLHRHPELPAAWLALDPEDNDPVLFLSALIATLQRLSPSCGATVQPLLMNQGAAHLDIRRMVALLLNEVESYLVEPFVLVLDDLHSITNPAIHGGLDYLLSRMPPQMHLLVATRSDPPLSLALLRARGQLAELRLPELRFTPEETEKLLNNCLHLDLSQGELRSLYTYTEGWVAGLRLMAASLPTAGDDQRTGFIKNLAPTDRYVFHLLAEEVLAKQPPAIRDFLLKTSILEELTPTLCTSLLGQNASLLLEEVYRRNLFLVALDGGASLSTSYRYHSLFKEFLHHRLTMEHASEIALLHSRAAAASQIPARAIRHYLAAEAWEEAAHVMEGVVEQTFNRGLFAQIREWITTLPEEVRVAHPKLSFFLGATHWGLSQYQEAIRYLGEAVTGFAVAEDDVGRGETLVQLSIVHQTLADFEPAAEYTRRAQGLPLSVRSQTQLYFSEAWLALAKGDLASAQVHLDAAHTLAMDSNDMGALQICVLQTRGLFLCLPDGVRSVRQMLHLIESREPGDLDPLRAAADGLRMFLYFSDGNLDEAIAAGERARALSQRLGDLTWLMIEVGFLLPQLYASRGNSQQANHLFSEHAHYLHLFPGWRSSLLYARAHAQWVQGPIEEARRVAAQLQQDIPLREWPVGPVGRSMMRGLLALTDKQYGVAEQHLREAARLQQQVPLSIMLGHASLQLAMLYHAQGQHNAALHELGIALRELSTRGTIGLALLEGVKLVAVLKEAVARGVQVATATQLLATLEASRPSSGLRIEETGEILTPREVEVLCLLATGASNQKIAEELVVSIPTVKTHISRILSKLGAHSRTEAVARARELHLL